ncbi:MAG: 50S ribosomal protein L15 [Armatimonadota bacterium]
MKLSDLAPPARSRRRRKRVGRGISAGRGKTCGRGQKGQKARGRVPRGFEGGQTPLFRRLPKLRGQRRSAMNIGIFRREYAVVNVERLGRFRKGTVVDPDKLREAGLVKKVRDGIKILGRGELKKELTVRAHAFSASAREKIEAAGGSVEVI